MKKILLVCLSCALVLSILEGITERVAGLPNKSRIISFSHMQGAVPTTALRNIQERYDLAVYTNTIWGAPSIRYVLNGKSFDSYEMNTYLPNDYYPTNTKGGTIRFKYQIFPRRYYMSYNPIGFLLYISDRPSTEYYGGVVLTEVTPEMLDLKIKPFGRRRCDEVAFPRWVSHMSNPRLEGEGHPNIDLKYPQELEVFANTFIAPYLYVASRGAGIVSSESQGSSDERNDMPFYDFPFSVFVNDVRICGTVRELYDDSFLADFQTALALCDEHQLLQR